MTTLPDNAGPVLLTLARTSIATALGLNDRGASSPRVKLVSDANNPPHDASDEAWLSQPGASFVTLRIEGALRGCIGSLVAHQPLKEDVRRNARAAAFEDPRFYPLSKEEFEEIDIEVSVLSDPEPMHFTTREEALAMLRPGIDGVVLTASGRRATFLPQVWEELPDRELFIAHLMRKAGLPMDYWDDSVRIERYTVTAYDEAELAHEG